MEPRNPETLWGALYISPVGRKKRAKNRSKNNLELFFRPLQKVNKIFKNSPKTPKIHDTNNIKVNVIHLIISSNFFKIQN
jgi:hypothetical protein